MAQILKVVSPLGEKAHIFLGFEIQRNYDSETLEFKLHSFRAFQQYLTDKRMVEEHYQFFQFSARSF